MCTGAAKAALGAHITYRRGGHFSQFLGTSRVKECGGVWRTVHRKALSTVLYVFAKVVKAKANVQVTRAANAADSAHGVLLAQYQPHGMVTCSAQGRCES